jgi:NADP-dependent 3-hydroxy acid dehydrogenase YdfG
MRLVCLAHAVVETEFYHIKHMRNEDAVHSKYSYQALSTQHVAWALWYPIRAPPLVNVDDIIWRSIAHELCLEV